MIRRFLFCLLPLLVFSLLALILELFVPNLPIVAIHIDIGLILFSFGGLISLFLLIIWVVLVWNRMQVQSALARQRSAQSEAQNRFLRRLDHELKNPITGIRAALANLVETGAAGSKSSALPDIQRQADRMSKLTAGLRKLADLEEVELEPSRVDLGSLLEETAEALNKNAGGVERQVRLVIPRIPWPLPPVMADADLIGLAFYNLLDNAMKYSRAGDTVEVRASEHNRSVQVEIADTGPGIPSDELPRIFEELFRGSNARGNEGSGLGLPLTRRIIERHGGTIGVKSRMGDKSGTIFTIQLPID